MLIKEHRVRQPEVDKDFYPWPKPWIYYFLTRCARYSVVLQEVSFTSRDICFGVFGSASGDSTYGNGVFEKR